MRARIAGAIVGIALVACSEGPAGPAAAPDRPVDDGGEGQVAPRAPQLELPSAPAAPLELPSGAEAELALLFEPGAVAEIIADGGGTVTLSGDVLFATGRAELTAAAQDGLRSLLDDLEAHPEDAELSVVGHTDSRGSSADNRTLSLARAEAVRDWFVAQRFPAAAIRVEGAGEDRLLLPDVDEHRDFDEEAGRANRRVEIVVSFPEA